MTRFVLLSQFHATFSVSAVSVGILWILWLVPAAESGAQVSAQPGLAIDEARLMGMLDGTEQDAAIWRLVAGLRRRRGDWLGALDALRVSLTMDPNRAATHFDLAVLLREMGRGGEADQHFARTFELAPRSEYGTMALEQLGGSETEPAVRTTAFELEPNRVTSIPAMEWSGVPLPEHLVRIESGAAYNSNVSLAPLSRQPSDVGTAGPQVFFSPAVERTIWRRGGWTGGVSFEAVLNWNERRQRDYDLQSFTPAAFAEYAWPDQHRESAWFLRTEYDFTYDAFALQTFGRRHGVTTSLHRYVHGGNEIVLSYRWDYADFAEQGPDPPVTSFDGWTHTLSTGWILPGSGNTIDRLLMGCDIQWAPLTGTLYAYRSVYLYADVRMPSWREGWIGLQGGWGLRDYYRSALGQNESLYHAAVRWNVPLGRDWSAVAFFTYDRFGSQVESFQADRTLAGMMLVFER